jgi:hypothetical protein
LSDNILTYKQEDAEFLVLFDGELTVFNGQSTARVLHETVKPADLPLLMYLIVSTTTATTSGSSSSHNRGASSISGETGNNGHLSNAQSSDGLASPSSVLVSLCIRIYIHY